MERENEKLFHGSTLEKKIGRIVNLSLLYFSQKVLIFVVSLLAP